MLFHLKIKLEPEEVVDAEKLAAKDPRLGTALSLAEDGNVIATLSGAPGLIARWPDDTADRYGQAIITAAITARRCGPPETIPQSVLEPLAVPLLVAAAGAPETVTWAQAAIRWAEKPVNGNIAALRRTATQPGVIDGYKVSDILLQYSYESACNIVRPLLADERTWALLLEHANPTARTDIGIAAYAGDMTTQAERAWQLAAESGDSRAMRMLGWLFFDRGEQSEVRRWFQRALDLGDIPAMRGFSYVLESYGDWPESLRWLREAAEQGDPAAMVDWGIQLESMGRLDEAETWFRRGADLGEALAMTDLGYLLARRGDQPGAEEWDRRAAALGQPGAMEHLAQMFQARGSSTKPSPGTGRQPNMPWPGSTRIRKPISHGQEKPPTRVCPMRSSGSAACWQRWGNC